MTLISTHSLQNLLEGHVVDHVVGEPIVAGVGHEPGVKVVLKELEGLVGGVEAGVEAGLLPLHNHQGEGEIAGLQQHLLEPVCQSGVMPEYKKYLHLKESAIDEIGAHK